MDVSIVIPFYNAESTLADCLDSLTRIEGPDMEVILVDNGSTDRSAGIASEFLARSTAQVAGQLIHEPRPGASAARNSGARAARGRWLAFTDADCIVGPMWLSAALAAAEDDADIAAVAGPLAGKETRGAVGVLHSLFTLRGLPADAVHRRYTLAGGGFATANLIVRRQVFEQIHGFDEAIPMHGEDHDLCARIYAAGFAIRFCRAAQIVHQHRSSVRATLTQSQAWGRSHALLLKRHFPDGWLLELGPWQWSGRGMGVPLWLSFRSADKKVAAMSLAAAFYGPLLLLLLVYGGFLVVRIHRRIPQHPKWTLAAAVAGLLILKSAAMTVGRINGSLRYRVVCL